MVRHDGHAVSQTPVLSLSREGGLLLAANYQRERRQLAQRRKAALAPRDTQGPVGCGEGSRNPLAPVA